VASPITATAPHTLPMLCAKAFPTDGSLRALSLVIKEGRSGAEQVVLLTVGPLRGKEAMEEQAKPKFLIGWAREQTEHGCVLTLQLAETAIDARTGHLLRSSVVMNDRQLRSLARGLAEGARERGLELSARLPWWQRLFAPGRQGKSWVASSQPWLPLGPV
jgi:hypothetical protein